MPGVYFLCYDHEIVYVGQSRDIPNRISQHKLEHKKAFNMVFYMVERHTKRRNALEQFYIKACMPKYNWIDGRDGKRFEPKPPIELGVVPMAK